MNVNTIDNKFDEIMILPDSERNRLFLRIKDAYSEEKTVAHTASGQPLTKGQYQERVKAGILQCKEGKCTSLEQLSEDLEYNYADL